MVHVAQSTSAPLQHFAFWCLSFSSIAILLLHLDGWLSMHLGALFLLGPSLAIMVVIALAARRRGDREFLRRVYLGCWGGVLGTLGYDVFRIPFHNAGWNVFAPIYAYGMWICGLEQATLGSDLTGFFYHLSNGVTFGLIYSIYLTKRTWWWALLWAMVLETLAIVTSFGAVFSVRNYAGVLAIAYVAHVFYGLPLGVICERWGETQRRWNRLALAGTVALTLALAGWFTIAIVPPAVRPPNLDDTLRFTTQGISAIWSNWPLGRTIDLLNELDSDAVLLVRKPSAVPGQPPTPIPISAGGRAEFLFDESGIYQFGLQEYAVRSVFVAIHRNGSYLPCTDPPELAD